MKSVEIEAKQSTVDPVVQAKTCLYTGHRYLVSGDVSMLMGMPHGVVSNYSVSSSQGKLDVPQATNSERDGIYIWDPDIDLNSSELTVCHDDKQNESLFNRCTINSNYMERVQHSLQGPELVTHHGVTRLALSIEVNFTFSTEHYAAQLGVVHLVEATRFLTLEGGKKISLLQTPEPEIPVLFLEDAEDTQAVKHIGTGQSLAEKKDYVYCNTIEQIIPEHYNDNIVETVTVLEQYRSYFMQRATSHNGDKPIWTPVLAPILWGWSIRVGRRVDHEWGILKRKLILPTPGNDGLQMPEWEDNTINCSNIII